MRFVNIDAVLNDLEAMRQRDDKTTVRIDTVIQILDGYPKLEFDIADRKDKS